MLGGQGPAEEHCELGGVVLGDRWVWRACYACCVLDSVEYISEKLQSPHIQLSVDVSVGLEDDTDTKENIVLYIHLLWKGAFRK